MLITAQAARWKPGRRGDGKVRQLMAVVLPEALWSSAANCQRRSPKRGTSASRVPGRARRIAKTGVSAGGSTRSGPSWR